MKIPRFYDNLSEYTEPGKALVIFGPRQVGKTTLVQQFLQTQRDGTYRFDTGDNIKVQTLFTDQDLTTILGYAEGYHLLVLDEAQRIPRIGMGLKMLVDHRPDLRIIVTGSASFALAGQIGEPLTGRKRTLTLYPVAEMELRQHASAHDRREDLASRLVFGGYPSVITARTKQRRIETLEEIAHAYLLKDILELERVKGSKVLLNLLRLLAFQIGSEVSLSELARQLQIDTKTVARYLDLFEQAFVLVNLRGYSRNLRKEVTKKSKYYFYDTGIRNAIIANFNTLDVRNDVGQLWENFVVMERLKFRAYTGIPANMYFWRTWDQQEIDLVEEREGRLFGYECAWRDGARAMPRDWQREYPDATFATITSTNYLAFVTSLA